MAVEAPREAIIDALLGKAPVSLEVSMLIALSTPPTAFRWRQFQGRAHAGEMPAQILCEGHKLFQSSVGVDALDAGEEDRKTSHLAPRRIHNDWCLELRCHLTHDASFPKDIIIRVFGRQCFPHYFSLTFT